MASTLRDGLLPALDIIRGIPGLLGLRPYSVTCRVRTWSGERAGVGVAVDVDYPLTVSLGSQPVKVRALSQREVAASGGLYKDHDVEVGPLTPPYPGSSVDNTATAIFDPSLDGKAREVWFEVVGPFAPDSRTRWYKKISQSVDRPLRYMLVLRNTGEQP